MPTIWGYFRRYRLMLVRGAVGGLLYNTLIVLGPILLGRALDAALVLERGGFQPAASRSLAQSLVLLVVATAAFQGFRTLKRWDFRRMSNRIGTDLGHDLLAASMSWPMSRLDRERTGDLMSRAVGDAQVVAETVMTTVTEVFDTWVLMAAYFVALLAYDPWLTLISAVTVPFTALLANHLGGAVFRRSTAARAAASRINSHLQETLTGVRVLRLFGREPAERERLEVLCHEQLDANLHLTRLMNGLLPLYAGLASVGLVAVIGVGGRSVVQGAWSVGQFTAYLTMFQAMTGRTLMAARVLNRLHAGRAAWVRIAAKLEPGAAVAAEAGPPGGRVTAPVGQARPVREEHGLELELHELTFRFPGDEREALNGVNLTIPQGALVCVTGPVGCGKSALALALTGLYPYGGSIRLGGRELRDVPAAERRGMISYLGQEPFLFSESIAANVTFGAGGAGEDAKLARAVEGAGLGPDLSLLPKGLGTAVGQRGTQVSGGQRQRIALARAMYRGSPLLLLDDPFSAVDVVTERRIVASLRHTAAGATVLLFSHRLGAFPGADLVVLLDGGRVAVAEKHEALMAQAGLYARIFQAQTWLEENAVARARD